MDQIISLLIWIVIIIIVTCITAYYGVRYVTGIALGLVVATIIMFVLEEDKNKLSSIFMLGLLFTFIYIILYVIINASQEAAKIDGEIFYSTPDYTSLSRDVEDKIQFRDRGNTDPMTRRPVGSKTMKGGNKMGEMEFHALSSH